MLRDLGVTAALREFLPEWAVEVFAILTVLGDWLLVVPLLALLYVADVLGTLRGATAGEFTGTSAEPRDSDAATDTIPHRLCSDRTVFLIATVFGGMALGLLLKAVFGLGRPPVELHAIPVSEQGFPSGHTLTATVFWGAVAAWTSIGPRRVRYGLAMVVITTVAFSRLALGVHYLPDVLVSLTIGTAYLLLVWWLTDGQPLPAFAIALVLAVGATGVGGVETRTVLSLVGIVGALVGWRVVEAHPVRRVIWTGWRMVHGGGGNRQSRNT